jgi:DNA-directed RNA polymerase beta' subunit
MSKRLLTDMEIENILSFIIPQKGIPIKSAMSVVNNTKNKYIKKLKTEKIYPNMIPFLKDMTEQQYMSSLIQPGESVGVISAQSIGEKQTQTMLNSFHTAGKDGNGATGVPKLEELLNASKPKISGYKAYMKKKHNTIAEVRETIGDSLSHITFKTITKSYEICRNKKPEQWYEAFKIMYGNESPFPLTDCITLTLNMDVIYEYKLDMDDIARTITSEYLDMYCVYSPDNIGVLDVYSDMTDINLPIDRLVYINTYNAKDIYLEEVVYPNLSNITICGIEGVSDVYYNKDVNMVDIVGNNYQKILGLPYIDNTITLSNNVWDIYKTLGIEATRQFLINAFTEITEGVNSCHIELLVDKMTFGGSIASISRYSMRTEECGAFAKCSFEETLDNFLRAGIFGQEEQTKGVSASIICGKVAAIGTGTCSIKMNMLKLMNAPSNILTEVKEIEHPPSPSKIYKKEEPIKELKGTIYKKNIKKINDGISIEDEEKIHKKELKRVPKKKKAIENLGYLEI